MQGHSLSRIHRRLLRQRSSRGLELLIQSRTHLQQSTSRLHRSMARPTRSRTRNLSLGPLVQHKPPSPRPGRNHTATSRKQTHNNTKESGLKIPTQNPGLDNPPNRANTQSTPPCSRTTPIRWNLPDGADPHRRRARASTLTDDRNTRRSQHPSAARERQRHRGLPRRCLRPTPDQYTLSYKPINQPSARPVRRTAHPPAMG